MQVLVFQKNVNLLIINCLTIHLTKYLFLKRNVFKQKMIFLDFVK